MASSPVPVKQQAAGTFAGPDFFQTFRTEIDRLFDRFMGGFGMPAMRRMFDPGSPMIAGSSAGLIAPAVDVIEETTSYKITAELPGATEKDIEVNLMGDTLTLKGEKRQESERRGENYYISERSFGSFHRSFMLPEDVDREKIAAAFTKGVLTVTLPKNATAKASQKKIEVKPGT
jgi:HSP20 family protein